MRTRKSKLKERIKNILLRYHQRKSNYISIYEIMGKDYENSIQLRAIKNVLFDKVLVLGETREMWILKTQDNCSKYEDFITCVTRNVQKEIESIKSKDNGLYGYGAITLKNKNNGIRRQYR